MRENLLSVRELGKNFARRRWFGRPAAGHWALQDISLELARGRTLGVTGPSGSGKSTLARCIAAFETPTCGEILLEGRKRWNRPEVQLIFQQPAATLNPRFTAEEIVAEPLAIQRLGPREWRRKRAAQLMEMAGLPAGSARKKALEFSGGERQRLALARALAPEPKLLILDESLTGLDLSVQAQMVNLLAELRQRLGLTCILISHDAALAAEMADDLVAIKAGRRVA